ncbi:hypothetical protein QTO34_004874, partial [Cnephaeus nilssonii]
MAQTLSSRCRWRRELSIPPAQSATQATPSPTPPRLLANRGHSKGPCNTQEDTPQRQSPVEAAACRQAAGERPDFSKGFIGVFSPLKLPVLVRMKMLHSNKNKAVALTQGQKACKASSSDSLSCISSKDKLNALDGGQMVIMQVRLPLVWSRPDPGGARLHPDPGPRLTRIQGPAASPGPGTQAHPDPGARGLTRTRDPGSPGPGTQAHPDPGARGLTRTRDPGSPGSRGPRPHPDPGPRLTWIQGPAASPGPGTQAHLDPGPRLTRIQGPAASPGPGARLTRIQGPAASPGPGARLTRIQGPAASPGPGAQAHPDPGARGLARTRGPGSPGSRGPRPRPDPGPRLTRIQGPAASPGPGAQAHPDPGARGLARTRGPGSPGSRGPRPRPDPGPRLTRIQGPAASPGPGAQAHPDPGARGLARTRGRDHVTPKTMHLNPSQLRRPHPVVRQQEKSLPSLNLSSVFSHHLSVPILMRMHSINHVEKFPVLEPLRSLHSSQLNSREGALQRRHKAVGLTQRQKAWKASSSEGISSKDKGNDAGRCVSQDNVPQPESPVEATACSQAAAEKPAFSEHLIAVSTPSKRPRLDEDGKGFRAEGPVLRLLQRDNTWDRCKAHENVLYACTIEKGCGRLIPHKGRVGASLKKDQNGRNDLLGKVHKDVPFSPMSEKKHLIAREPMLDSRAQEKRGEADRPAQPPAVGGYPSAKTPEWLVALDSGFRCMACCRVFPSLEVLQEHVECGVREGFSCHVFHRAMAHLKYKERMRKKKEKKRRQ